MLKFIASMSLAALLSLSPALAHETNDAPAAAPKRCDPPAKVLQTIPAKPITQITKPADIADFVAGFDTYVAAHGGPKNLIKVQGIELIILFPRPDDAVMYVTFVNGCAMTMGSFALEAIDTIVKPQATPDEPTKTPMTPEQKNFSSKDDGKL